MYEFISGKHIESSPAHVVIENHGIGYLIHISLNTYSQIHALKEISLYIHENIREDAYTLFGFYEKPERELFRHLISVSGVGANTARMILSSASLAELHGAIVHENLNLLKSIKGIGLKTAQRIVIDLKDKLSKDLVGDIFSSDLNNTIREEALSALVMLGFAKNNSQKVVEKILTENPSWSVELVIKQALKML